MLLARMGPVEGARLTRIGDEIWVADRELILSGGIRLPVRMVVLRDPRRRLLCYSPVGLDPQTQEALAGLGEVTWLAVPNRFHRTFLSQARAAFHDARVIGGRGDPSGSVEALAGEGDIGGLVDYRVVQASPQFAELVLYHDCSETLVVSDLIVNVSMAQRPLRWWLKLNGSWGHPAQPRIGRLLLRDSRALAEFYGWAMARPFRQISMSHGGIIREQAREIVYRLFRPDLNRAAATPR